MTEMNSEKIQQAFKEAVSKVNGVQKAVAVDTKLKLYALYKIATNNQQHPSGEEPHISAFKANALFQAKHLNELQAMQQYIAIVKEELDT